MRTKMKKAPLDLAVGEDVYEAVMEAVKPFQEQEGCLKSGLCLYSGYFAVRELRKRGLNAQIQAGSAQWPLITPEMDDGVRPTHFGYVWGEVPVDPFKIAQGLLPEMHVWAAIAETGLVVDMAAGWFPAQAKAIQNFDWPGPKPPKFVWATAEQMPDWAVYQPAEDAIRLTLGLVYRMFGYPGLFDIGIGR